jgi:hypothetical protein
VPRLVEVLLSTPLDWAKDESIATALKEPVRPFHTFKYFLDSPAQIPSAVDVARRAVHHHDPDRQGRGQRLDR